MFKAAEKMSHPRLGHRLKYWFLLDLVSQEHMPLHILGLCFPLGAGAWEDLREAWVRGGGKHLCNTQVTLPCSQWRFSLWCLTLAFSQICFSASLIANLPLTLCEHVTQTEVLIVGKFSSLTF